MYLTMNIIIYLSFFKLTQLLLSGTSINYKYQTSKQILQCTLK